jgi:uncharacterized protein (DUF427 family)
MKTPGPDHPITLEPAASRWRVRVGGHVVADSNAALVLREAAYPARIYFPREDVALEYMSRTERRTHCPYKGDAAYYTLFIDGEFLEDVAWSYEAPFPAMEAIAGRLSFYPERVEVYEVEDAAVNPDYIEPTRAARGVTVDEVIQHTDAGDGTSQREHWRPAS